MRPTVTMLATAVALTVLMLSACTQRSQLPPLASSSLNEDDDIYCRAGGKVAPGSSEYVTCRQNRDAQRGNAIAHADKKQRDLAQDMLDHPVHP